PPRNDVPVSLTVLDDAQVTEPATRYRLPNPPQAPGVQVPHHPVVRCRVVGVTLGRGHDLLRGEARSPRERGGSIRHPNQVLVILYSLRVRVRSHLTHVAEKALDACQVKDAPDDALPLGETDHAEVAGRFRLPTVVPRPDQSQYRGEKVAAMLRNPAVQIAAKIVPRVQARTV